VASRFLRCGGADSAFTIHSYMQRNMTNPPSFDIFLQVMNQCRKFQRVERKTTVLWRLVAPECTHPMCKIRFLFNS